MKKVKMILVIVSALFVLSSIASAMSGGPYILNRRTIDSGGGVSCGGSFTLSGTIGQPDAGYHTKGKLEVLGGFWSGSPSCFVEFEDYARFAQYWHDSGAEIPADLYSDGQVDWHDVSEFCYWWLYECPYRWPLK